MNRRKFLFLSLAGGFFARCATATNRSKVRWQTVKVTIDNGVNKPLTKKVRISADGTILDAINEMKRRRWISLDLLEKEEWPYNGKVMITGIGQFTNNPDSGKFWCLFIGPKSVRPVQLASAEFYLHRPNEGLATKDIEPSEQVYIKYTLPDGPYT